MDGGIDSVGVDLLISVDVDVDAFEENRMSFDQGHQKSGVRAKNQCYYK